MSEPLIRTARHADGVLVATIDMVDRTMNVFSAALMDALEALLDEAERDDAVRSVVITSAKPTFLAGADLTMVRGFTQNARRASHETMFALCGRLGRQFVRLEESKKPWIAAVNGIALGGGLELALACRVRLVADDPRIQLGVPEVRWGLLPGAGGTQRMPRLMGCEPALDLLLSGRSVDPATAVQRGLFDRAVPAASLLDEACAVARSLQGSPYDAAIKFKHLDQVDVPTWSAAAARDAARRHGIDDEAFARYPAYSAIVDSVLKGARMPLGQATAIEMDQFLRLMFDPTAGRMVRTLFLERVRAEAKLAAPADAAIEKIVCGPLEPDARVWADALGKSKLPLEQDPGLAANTLEIVGRDGRRARIALAALGDEATSTADSLPLAVLTPSGPYGRVVETVGADAPTHALVSTLAGRLRALAWRTPGRISVLQRLRGKSLPDQASLALDAARDLDDPTLLDTVACLAGVTPAWTGGPLTWAWAEKARMDSVLSAAARATLARIEPVLARDLA